MHEGSRMAPRRRRGQLLPMVGVVLILFAFLSFSYMFQSQSNTSITGLSIYGMQAHQLAMGFADEAALVLMEKFDETQGAGEWKQELVQQLAGQQDGAPIVLDKGDIRDQLVESLAMLGQVNNAELTFLDLRLHGFHRLHYAGNDIYDAPSSYYSNRFLDQTEDNRQPVEDWVGYATIQVRVRVRGIERQVQVTRDLKVVDVQPPAREFAYMNWLGLTQQQAGSGLGQISLNQGGDMAIWPNEVGRVMIRGPYVVVTEGKADCTGGETRGGAMRQNYSYPDNDRDWYGWSVIPGRRALVWNQVAMPWGTNIRPGDDGVNFAFRARYITKDFVSLDSNASEADCPSQQYMCGATDVGKQTFSVWGRPGRPIDNAADGFTPANALSMPRMLKVDFNQGGGTPVAAYETGNNLGGGSDGDGITIEEGGLIALVNQAKFENIFGIYACLSWTPPWACFGANTYSGFSFWPGGGPCTIGFPCLGGMTWTMAHNRPVEPASYSGAVGADYIATLYAVRMWEEEPANIWASLIGAALSFVMAQSGSNTIFGGSSGTAAVTDAAGNVTQEAVAGTFSGTMSSVASNFTMGAFMQTIGGAITDSVMTNMASGLTGGAFGGGSTPGSGELAQAIPQGLFPPKFRNYMRGASRIHRKFEDAVSPADGTLNLDGIVLVETMPQDQATPINYKGKGVLMSVTDGEANKSPFLGDVVPADPDNDWLTFAHLVQREPQPDGGDCQVKLASTNMEFSLYAEEGVTTEGSSALFGNMVTATPNKYRIPAGDKFDVFYNAPRLAPSQYGGPADAQWSDGTWRRVTVSPKVSGYYDRFR